MGGRASLTASINSADFSRKDADGKEQSAEVSSDWNESHFPALPLCMAALN